MFANLLDPADARRATEVVAAVFRHGLRGALTAGSAIEAQLRAHGQPIERRPLNDIDLVVENFAAIPEPIVQSFLQHYVHADATYGRTLLQPVDEEHRIRVDLFRTLGMSLTRAQPLDDETGDLDVLSVEDLLARTTSLVYGRLRRGLEIDVKHALCGTVVPGAAFCRSRDPEIVRSVMDDRVVAGCQGRFSNSVRPACRLRAARL